MFDIRITWQGIALIVALIVLWSLLT